MEKLAMVTTGTLSAARNPQPMELDEDKENGGADG
jgi:hypothetical protein